MTIIKVAGLDPSLCNFGMVRGDLDLITGNFTITDMSLQSTESDNKNKKRVRKNSDDLNRARLLYKGMTEFITGCGMVFVEIPVGSQTARAMCSYGICIGVIASINTALIQVTPNEVKLAATSNKTASKADMINWAVGRYPDAGWIKRKSKGQMVIASKNEHLADAIAAIHAGVKTDEFRYVQSIFMKTF